MLPEITIAAVGDISFAGARADTPGFDLLREVQNAWQEHAVVCANLEGPLTTVGNPVPGKCTLRSAPEWADTLHAAGINLVSLANNHLMDYGVPGLESTVKALDRAGIRHVGAGRNIAEAQAPLFLDINGIRLAFLSRTSVIVSSPSYAGVEQPGVAWLDETETLANIVSCRRQADAVVLLIHWGMEEHRYPMPAQRALARQFIFAGADLILGHHPHVVQGFEYIDRAAVAYSLGNFILDDFEWYTQDDAGNEKKVMVRMLPKNRIGTVLRCRLGRAGVKGLEMVPTHQPCNAGVSIEPSPKARNSFFRLNKALSLPGYSYLWHLYAAWMEWELRFKPRFLTGGLLRRLTKVRLRHFLELAKMIRRSSRVAGGRTTNPYE